MLRPSPAKSKELHRRILDVLNRQKRAVSLPRLAALLDTAENDDQFREAVLRLRQDGLIYAERGYRYAKAPAQTTKRGTISIHERGFGFVAPEDGGEDIFIPESRIGDAISGDRVLVTSSPRRGRPGLHSGAVLGVIERPERTMVGTLRLTIGPATIHPDDPAVPDMVMHGPLPDDATDGLKVVGTMLPITLTDTTPSVRFDSVLGSPSDPETAMQSIIHRFGLHDEYPAEALHEARQIDGELSAEEYRKRRDLRSAEVLTVDPADAADLDDALSLTTDERGRKVVGIHIADVAHYVEKGGAIDREAVERGTSVYLPGRVLHMLPKELSAGVCSLLPNVDRFAMSVFVTFDNAANPVHTEIAQTVIRSRAKLAYEDVEAVIQGEAEDDNPAAPFADTLKGLAELSQRLTQRRIDAGALDFDIPEVHVRIGEDGHVASIDKRERLLSHRLVEEFMLLANTSVAHELNARGYDLLYRVHDGPDPEKLSQVITLAATLGHPIKTGDERPSVQQIQRLLEAIKGEPIAPVIETHLLRSMAKAMYQPENIGHFGLATDEYAHFTSPIRRYPDLVVHRQTKRMIESKPTVYSRAELDDLGRLTSESEQVAEQAEREATKIKQAEYLAEHLGEEFDGTISGVMRSGIFVVLNDTLAEGYIGVASLPDDEYYHDQEHMSLSGKRRRLQFHFGDPVTVQVAQVDTDQGRIDFEFISAPRASERRTASQASELPKRDRKRKEKSKSRKRGNIKNAIKHASRNKRKRRR